MACGYHEPSSSLNQMSINHRSEFGLPPVPHPAFPPDPVLAASHCSVGKDAPLPRASRGTEAQSLAVKLEESSLSYTTHQVTWPTPARLAASRAENQASERGQEPGSSTIRPCSNQCHPSYSFGPDRPVLSQAISKHSPVVSMGQDSCW